MSIIIRPQEKKSVVWQRARTDLFLFWLCMCGRWHNVDHMCMYLIAPNLDVFILNWQANIWDGDLNGSCVSFGKLIRHIQAILWFLQVLWIITMTWVWPDVKSQREFVCAAAWAPTVRCCYHLLSFAIVLQRHWLLVTSCRLALVGDSNATSTGFLPRAESARLLLLVEGKIGDTRSPLPS